MMKNSTWTKLLCFALLAASAHVAGCGDDTVRTVSTGVTCGDGTVALDGQCVPEGTPVVCGDGTMLSADSTMCVPEGGANNGEVTTCGAGTRLEGNECVPDGTGTTCGAGTTEANGECVPNCGPGTTLQGDECVLDADPVVCGDGTTLMNGECVPTPTDPPCGPGTMFDGTECVIVDPFADATVLEGDEPNDTVIEQRNGTPTTVNLGAEGEVVWVGGTIDEPSVVQLGDGQEALIADFDTYTVTLNKGNRLRIETMGIGAPQAAAFIEYSPADDETDAPVFQRLMVAWDGRNATREIVAPISGTYAITVGYQTDLLDAFGLTNPFFGPFGEPTGGEDFTYLLGVTVLANPEPAVENGVAFTWSGDLAEIPQLRLDAEPGSLVDLQLEVNGAATNGLYWLSSVDYSELLGTFGSGRHVVPAGGLLITADHFWIAGEDSTFTLTGIRHVPEDGGMVAGGTTVTVDEQDLGLGGEANWTLDVTEPVVLQVATRAGDDSFAQPVAVVRNDQYGVLAVSNLDGDERSLAVALPEAGTYYVQIIENSGLLGDMVPYTADVDIDAAPLWGLGADPVLTAAHPTTMTTEPIDADGQGFFWLEASDLGDLHMEGSAAADVGLQLFTGAQLAEGGVWNAALEADGAPATIDATLGGRLFVRVTHAGAARTDVTVSATHDPIDFTDETEPNQDIGEADALGTLSATPKFARGALTLGDESAVVDTWSFTVTTSSIVTVTTFGIDGNAPDTTLTILDGNQSELAFNDDLDFGELNSQVALLLPAGEYYAQVDGFLGGQEGPYGLVATAEALDDVPDFGVGDTATRDIVLGYDENFNPNFFLGTLEVTAPMVVEIAVDPTGTNSEPEILVANADLEVIASASSFFGPASVIVALPRTGTYFFQIGETGFFADTNIPLQADITSLGALNRLGTAPLTAANPMGSATTNDLANADTEAFFWVEVGDFGDATLTASPQANLDVELQIFSGAQLGSNGSYDPTTDANDAGAGGEEVIEGRAGGAWFVRVANVGAAAATMGGLTVTASLDAVGGIVDEDEPNDDVSVANALGALTPGTTRYGAGRTAPGPEDERGFPGPSADVWSFSLAALSEVTIEVIPTGGNADFDLRLLDRGQNTLGSSFSGQLVTVLDPGTWYVEVDSFDDAEYVLTIDTRALACRPGVQVCAGNDVQICNADGSALDTFTCGLGCSETEAGAGCDATTEAEPNDTADVADDLGALALDAVYPVEAELASTPDARDDDWFSFTLDSAAVVTLETIPSLLDPQSTDTELWLYNGANAQLANDDDGGEGNFSKIGPRALDAGTYFIRVEYYSTFTNGAGTYRLEILVETPQCDPGAAICDGDNLTVCDGLEYVTEGTCATSCIDPGDGTASCALPASTPIGPRPWTSMPDAIAAGEVDWYSIEITTPAIVTFTFGSSGGTDFDARAFLCDEASVRANTCAYGFGANLAQNDDGAGNLYPSLTYDFTTTGTYFIGLGGWTGEAGDYQLDVTEQIPDGDDTPETANAITLPTMVDASMDVPMDQDWYTFTLAADATVSIEVISNLAALDMRVTLCDAAQANAGTCAYFGSNIATGDQGFGGEADTITEALGAGQYYILVEAWDDSSGDYTLTVGFP